MRRVAVGVGYDSGWRTDLPALYDTQQALSVVLTCRAAVSYLQYDEKQAS
ncbi:hypothetical protein KCP71_17400 [Salmonella enterica subsp. enterica]|nr:hypothetical protein KCP71_17400 [Salmonella enterica subsp. enterica]